MTVTKEKSIGVFDSGVGGLTAVRELNRLLPSENIIYFGDTARVPYGSHSPETIIRFAKQDLRFLLQNNVKAVLIACGTVSSTAINVLRTMTDIPIVGVIEAASKKAVEVSKHGKIAVLATQATVSSHAYKKKIEILDKEAEVIEKACPLFVPLIENGYIEETNQITNLIVDEYLKEVLSYGPDTIILGCTHYPIIKSIIHNHTPNAVIVEAGKEAAIELSSILGKHGSNNISIGIRRYIVSEKTENFSRICEMFLGEQITEDIEVIEMD